MPYYVSEIWIKKPNFLNEENVFKIVVCKILAILLGIKMLKAECDSFVTV